MTWRDVVSSVSLLTAPPVPPPEDRVVRRHVADPSWRFWATYGLVGAAAFAWACWLTGSW